MPSVGGNTKPTASRFTQAGFCFRDFRSQRGGFSLRAGNLRVQFLRFGMNSLQMAQTSRQNLFGLSQHFANPFKGYTSRVLRQEFAHLRSQLPSLWSRSYYVGSAGYVSSKVIQKYIQEQNKRE